MNRLPRILSTTVVVSLIILSIPFSFSGFEAIVGTYNEIGSTAHKMSSVLSAFFIYLMGTFVAAIVTIAWRFSISGWFVFPLFFVGIVSSMFAYEFQLSLMFSLAVFAAFLFWKSLALVSVNDKIQRTVIQLALLSLSFCLLLSFTLVAVYGFPLRFLSDGSLGEMTFATIFLSVASGVLSMSFLLVGSLMLMRRVGYRIDQNFNPSQ